MNKINLSVVTICYENPIELARTLSSVYDRFHGRPFEQIVIDGSRSSGCREVVKRFSWIDKAKHSSDSGIYDAMNRGAALAEGTFVWFLNSGDEVEENLNADVLFSQIGKDYGRSVLFSHVLTGVGEKRYLWKSPRPENLSADSVWLPPHQAIFYPRSLFDTVRYDCSMRISADSKLTRQALLLYPAREIDQICAVFHLGGRSNVKRTANEVREHLREWGYARGREPGIFRSIKMFLKFYAMKVLGWETYYSISFTLKPAKFRRVK